MSDYFHGWRRKAGCVALVIGCCAVAALLRSYLDPFDDDRFIHSVWIRSAPSDRAGMARDVIANHIRHGMTEEGVEAMLGTPDNALPNTYAYSLGQLDGLTYAGWDDALLHVHFDAERRVVTAEVTGQ